MESPFRLLLLSLLLLLFLLLAYALRQLLRRDPEQASVVGPLTLRLLFGALLFALLLGGRRFGLI